MTNLEDLLLEAAGRTSIPGNRHSRPPSGRQWEASYSDDGSDSNDDNLDDCPGFPTKKLVDPPVPLKKSLDPSEKDDDLGIPGKNSDSRDDNPGSGSDESDVGSDLYKDENDREQLAQMTELERELILSDRAQKRDDQQLAKRVRAKQSGKKTQVAGDSPEPPSCVRSSARFAKRETAKDGVLNELRAKRLKQQDPEGECFIKNTDKGIYIDQYTSPARKTSILDAQGSDSSESENQSQSHISGEESAGEEDPGDSVREMSSNEEMPTFEDITKITIRRSKLATWLVEPFFEQLIGGCFVRVGIGMKDNLACYRLCIVKNVDTSEPHKQYRLENRNTHKYLNVTWGRSEARWQMSVISDSSPLEVEFNEWLQAVKRDGVRIPSRKDILEKQEAIQKAITFVYSSATVQQMVQEKKSTSSRPLNIAAEKERLRREMDAAESMHNGEVVEKIKERLQELEEISRQKKVKDAKAVRLEEMNRKNRAENFKNASQLKPINTSLKAGEAGYDPFSRRWTRSTNYYVSKPTEGGEAGGSANAGAAGGSANADVTGKSLGSGGGKVLAGVVRVTGVTGLTTTVAALEAAADGGKLIDTKAPVDQVTKSNLLHNFELPISLVKLQRYGGAQGFPLGFMARKQKIEAAIGFKVSKNDGRRHPMTLTVSDYKRRRGLV